MFPETSRGDPGHKKRREKMKKVILSILVGVFLAAIFTAAGRPAVAASETKRIQKI